MSSQFYLLLNMDLKISDLKLRTLSLSRLRLPSVWKFNGRCARVTRRRDIAMGRRTRRKKKSLNRNHHRGRLYWENQSKLFEACLVIIIVIQSTAHFITIQMFYIPLPWMGAFNLQTMEIFAKRYETQFHYPKYIPKCDFFSSETVFITFHCIRYQIRGLITRNASSAASDCIAEGVSSSDVIC